MNKGKTISSSYTFFAKVLVPLLIMADYCVVMAPDCYTKGEDGVHFHAYLLLYSPLIFVSAGVALGALWLWGGLKRVHLADNELIVSNYLTEIKVPLDQIVDVSENKGWMVSYWYEIRVAKTVTAYLKSRCLFGKRITFLPRQVPYPASNPIVKELKQLAGLST